MKIGLVCYPTIGGSGVVASELGKALIKNGHEVHFFSHKVPFKLDPLADGFMFHEVKDSDYPLFEYPSYGMALSAKLTAVAKEFKIHVMHVHYAYPHSISAFIAREVLGCDIKFITTLHGTDITLVGQDPNFFDLVKFGIERSDKVTAVSTYLKNATNSLFKTTCDIQVVPNFIDTNLFKPIKDLPNKNEKIVIQISNFRPLKRPLDAIRFSEKLLEARLVMVGNGPLFDEAVGKGSHNVTFCDFQRDVISLIQRSDVMLITSQMESFGLAALEAMACGVPVVGTYCGGLEELVDDSVNGFLCQVGDIDSMIEKTRLLLNDTALYKKMSISARSKALEYDMKKIVPLYERIYSA